MRDLEKPHLEKTPFFEIDKWYSITINPDDKTQHFGKSSRESKVSNMLNERVLPYTTLKIDYIFYLELSEPINGKAYQNGPRLHFHGRIRFNSNKGLKEWLMLHYYNLLQQCIVDIDTIDDIDIWDKYCKKQQHIMRAKIIDNILTP